MQCLAKQSPETYRTVYLKSLGSDTVPVRARLAAPVGFRTLSGFWSRFFHKKLKIYTNSQISRIPGGGVIQYTPSGFFLRVFILLFLKEKGALAHSQSPHNIISLSALQSGFPSGQRLMSDMLYPDAHIEVSSDMSRAPSSVVSLGGRTLLGAASLHMNALMA